ncbi:isochorismate synthase [Prochlorococcus marinus str. MIT 9312]|uniref:isochorismate synthase n=1 Tax=Prochlorococcus marinus (strain MIT 9312) TaxID=74546 RepID=Q31D04_PROM9|nr:isochorismate synthase [Prochlorococcus marinus]ABB49241.1 isochorismate synthase [Prochlorococcus marinus str. MIT 9312]KGF99519.1 Isochorismate synthase Menaquinone-specific isochorismate synthase [Prochlorococcus marinus str. MIT 9311]
MKNDLKFTDFLKDLFSTFDKKVENSGLVSICVEIPCIDLFQVYELFINKYQFSSFWEESDGISYIAFDKCKYVTLDGPRRYEVAKEFNTENFKNLINLTNESHICSLSKIIYLFSFSENLNNKNLSSDVPSLEAILPKILIIKSDNNCWLRINGHVEGKSSLRILIEEIWAIRNQVINSGSELKKLSSLKNSFDFPIIDDFLSSLKISNVNLKKIVNKGIQLVDKGILEKIVLANRIKIKLKNKLDLVEILKRLKNNQPNTCRYVWKRNSKDIFFGASPEKLFSFTKPNLTFEALAGTISTNSNFNNLLGSSKDLKEHNYVINYLIKCLEILKIKKFKKSDIKVNSFGDISHLQTLIFSKVENICPFELLKNLHPSPAVCGYPKNEALYWINTLESFARGNYASPMGWVDSSGNASFLVAIRGARYIEENIEFTAGSGIVSGSVLEKEIDEIRLKFESLVKQIVFAKTSK